MSEQRIYFQWQNKVLERTIYPLRRMKLRHVLEYYMEIDLWAQYKGRKIEDIPGQVAVYHEKKAAVIRKAVQDYNDLLRYFYRSDPPPLAPDDPVDEPILAKIKSLHETFKTYYPSYTDSFRQSYFISQRLEALDRDRKELDKSIASQTRYLNSIKAGNPTHPKIPAEMKKLEGLKNARPLLEERREQLVALLSAFGRLEKRKKEYAKRLDGALRREREIRMMLEPLRRMLSLQEEKIRLAEAELRRLRTQPEPAPLERYFSTPEVTADIAARFQQTDSAFLQKVSSIHREIAALTDRQVKRSNLKNHIFNLQLEKTRFERRTGLNATFKENTLRAFNEELNRMKDFWSILDRERKTPDVLNQEIKAKEAEIARLRGPVVMKRKEAGALQSQLDELDDVLLVTEEKYLSEYTPVQPTVKEIALLEMDEYRDTLRDKDQYQLLEVIVERFKKEPRRYPRWLQYMIIHFSGMRYASAHGSWADPKDLYINLRTAAVEEELRGWSDDVVENMCAQKIAEYEPAPTSGLLPELEHEPPKLAKAQGTEWKEKIARHLARIKSDNPYSRRAGLFNLRLDEENYEAELMTAQEALTAVEDLGEKANFPNWMWKEISAVTDLRLKEARDKGWEKLTPEEQQKKNSAEWAKYRGIMNEWKKNNLTGWREEHERNAQSMVSRAVCNEVAEYIQHLRGHKGGAGLASKPDWYRGEENKAKGSANPDKAFLIKPRRIADYQVGASILWLQYRSDGSKPWNLAQDFTTSGGDRLVPGEYLGRRAQPGQWVYIAGGVERKRTVVNDRKQTVTTTQSLYWLHEATVAEVAETAEGRVVLTFETALPYEDRRLSSVGLFKHYEQDILYDGVEDSYNGSFVGYVPENPAGIPRKDLDEMLNWDHVLLKA